MSKEKNIQETLKNIDDTATMIRKFLNLVKLFLISANQITLNSLTPPSNSMLRCSGFNPFNYSYISGLPSTLSPRSIVFVSIL